MTNSIDTELQQAQPSMARFFAGLVGSILLTTVLWITTEKTNSAVHDLLLGIYLMGLGVLGTVCKFFFVRIPFLADIIAVEKSYWFLNSIVFIAGLCFFIGHFFHQGQAPEKPSSISSLTLRSSRTPPALPAVLSQHFAISASFRASVQARPVSSVS